MSAEPIGPRVVKTALCRLSEIPDGGVRGFSAPYPLFAVRRGARVFVYRDECPHQGAQLAWRRDAYLNHDGSRIVCWAHGAQFEVETGQCLQGACLGQRLRAVEHVVDGVIWVISREMSTEG